MKKSASFLFAFFCIAGAGSLTAQTVISSVGYLDLVGGTLSAPYSQSGSKARFLWWPDKAALVFGQFDATPSIIGQNSIAGGLNATASGAGSIALGPYSLGSNLGTIAIGGDPNDSASGAQATGIASLAIGE